MFGVNKCFDACFVEYVATGRATGCNSTRDLAFTFYFIQTHHTSERNRVSNKQNAPQAQNKQNGANTQTEHGMFTMSLGRGGSPPHPQYVEQTEQMNGTEQTNIMEPTDQCWNTVVVRYVEYTTRQGAVNGFRSKQRSQCSEQQSER